MPRFARAKGVLRGKPDWGRDAVDLPKIRFLDGIDEFCEGEEKKDAAFSISNIDDIEQAIHDTEKLTDSPVRLVVIPPTRTVKELWDTFLDQKDDVKESTLGQYGHVRRRFFEFFKESDLLGNITRERFFEWKLHLRKEVSKTTIARTLSKTKAVFNWAVYSGWIEESPLDGVGCGSYVNKGKDRTITLSDYGKILDACPDQNWRTLIALARLGGLRCPSEGLLLKWSDVYWEREQFLVQSPKTERYEGKGERIVPIFRELREELEALYFSENSVGQEFVINLSGYANREKVNIGPTFARIVKKAGLPPIVRPFDNMRMNRSNEVYRAFGAYLETQWIGHFDRTRADHYMGEFEADVKRAAQQGVPIMSRPGRSRIRKGGGKCLDPGKWRTMKFPTSFPTSRGRNGAARSRERRPARNRVGGGITPAVLPHHRTYGSVSGGSCEN